MPAHFIPRRGWSDEKKLLFGQSEHSELAYFILFRTIFVQNNVLFSLSRQFLTETLHSPFWLSIPAVFSVKFNWSTKFRSVAQCSSSNMSENWKFPYLDLLQRTGFSSNKEWWHSTDNCYLQPTSKHYRAICLGNFICSCSRTEASCA